MALRASLLRRCSGREGVRPDGSGLVGLRDRLAVFDGRLRVESPDEGGTVVDATIPLGWLDPVHAGFPARTAGV